MDLQEQIGKDIYFDLVDHDKVRSFRIQKQIPFNLFKVSRLLEIDIVRKPHCCLQLSSILIVPCLCSLNLLSFE